MIITLALTAGALALALLLTDYRIDRRDNEEPDYNDNEKKGWQSMRELDKVIEVLNDIIPESDIEIEDKQ